MRYALKYDIFNEIIKSKTRNVVVNSETRTLSNTNALLRTYEYADGGKTGYTGNAERCLICTATKDDMRIIAVVLGANSTELRFDTCMNIMEESFKRYNNIDVSDKLDMKITLPIIKGEEDKYTIEFKSDEIIYPIQEGEYDNIYLKENLVGNLFGGDIKGKYLGRLQLFLENELIYYKDYFLEENVQKKSVKKYIKEIFKEFLI